MSKKGFYDILKYVEAMGDLHYNDVLRHALDKNIVDSRASITIILNGLTDLGLLERSVIDTKPVRTTYKISKKGHIVIKTLKENYVRLKNDLGNHGLIGPEFTRKLKIYHYSRDLLFDKIRSLWNKIKKMPKKALVELAKKFLGSLDILLDSLTAVLPPLGATKEAKKLVEVVI